MRPRPKNSRRKSSGEKIVLSQPKDGALSSRRQRPDRNFQSTIDNDHDSPSSSSDNTKSTAPVTRERARSSPREHRPISMQDNTERQRRRQTVSASGAERRQEKSPDRLAQKPDPLSFLDSDSPEMTEERIQQAMAEAARQWSPRSVSSSASSNGSGSQRSTAETDATTPDPSVNGDAVPDDHFQTQNQQDIGSQSSAVGQSDRYGTPEMSRGSAKHPHIPPQSLQPRLSAPGQGHPKHLPRAEKLPMSGYELLSAKLSNAASTRSRRRSSSRAVPDETGEPSLKPIYRRFEALNHRLLLHLQDELSELEEQLHRLDTTDTQTRRLQNCILPASRRAEFMGGGELQWHKTDILGKIGFKLGQYSRLVPCSTPLVGGAG